MLILLFLSNEFCFLFEFWTNEIGFKEILKIWNHFAERENWQVFNVILLYEQVADLGMLRAETHKFESHYIDNLVGKLKDDIWLLILFIDFIYAIYV